MSGSLHGTGDYVVKTIPTPPDEAGAFSRPVAMVQGAYEEANHVICGSMNQTTQMHQISRQLRIMSTPSRLLLRRFDELLRRLGLMEFTIIGHKLAGRCRRYLEDHGLPIDYQGRNGPYDLVVTCSDVYVQKNIRTTGSSWFRRALQTRKPLRFVWSRDFAFSPCGWRARRPRA